jgi:hypothetical protein
LIEVMARIDRLPAPVDLPALASRSRSGTASSYLRPAPLISNLDWARPARRVKTVLAGAALIVLSLGIIYLADEYAFFRYDDDYPASTATTGQVAIGGSTTGTIERAGDADWFKVALASGKTYRFLLEGSDTGQGTLQYPVLRLLDGEWRPPPANRIPRYCSIRSSGYSHPPCGLLKKYPLAECQ